MCRLLDAKVRRSAALNDWACEPELACVRSVDEVIDRVRHLDAESDQVLGALLRVGGRDRRAVEVVVVALLPLVLSRCGRSVVRSRVDEVVGELALVVAQATEGGVTASGRRVANVLVDRAWAEVRRPSRRLAQPVPADPTNLGHVLVDREPDPADVAVQRVELEALMRSLAQAGPAQAKTIRAWNTAVALADLERRSEAERYRLKYARKVLRRAFGPDLVA